MTAIPLATPRWIRSAFTAALALFAAPLSAQQVKVYSNTIYPAPVAVPTITAPDVNGAFRFGSGTVDNARVGPVVVKDAYRAIETGTDNTLVSNTVIDGLKGVNLKRDGIRLRNISNVEIRNFDLQHSSIQNTPGHLPEGISAYSGSGLSIHDGRVAGNQMVWISGTYTNGDGIATEGAISNVLIERVTSEDNSDGGFDLKGQNILLNDTIARRNNRAYRIWGTASAGTITAEDFNGAGIWLGKGASFTVEKFIARSSRAKSIIFRWEAGATLIVKECDLTGMKPDARLTSSDGTALKVSLGPGCVVPK